MYISELLGKENGLGKGPEARIPKNWLARWKQSDPGKAGRWVRRDSGALAGHSEDI